MQVAVKNRLQRMDDYDFEHFVGDLWEQMGWNCEVSQASVDAGIDVVATKSNPYPQKELIQAKRYGPNTTVGGPAIQQYASLKQQQPGVDSVVVVTTNRFTRAAEKRADELNVKLVDGDGLVSMIDKLAAENIIEQYDSGMTEVAQPASGAQSAISHENDVSSKIENGFLHRIEEAYDWHRILLASGGLAFVLLVAGELLGSTGAGFLVALSGVVNVCLGVSIIVIAASLYLDIRYVRRHSSWKPTTWMYLVGLLVFYVTIPVYFYRRHKSLRI